MKTTLVLLLAAVSNALALSGHGATLHGRTTFGALDRRDHRHLARSLNSNPSALVRKRRSPLYKRKTPLGPDDSVTQPDNLAQGSFGSADGCTCWHTLSDGEVCLGLIDKSSAGFDLTAFYKYNPQVDTDCSNLVTGQAYCVDNGANEAASTTTNNANVQAADSKASDTPTAPSRQLATTSDTSDEEDCETDDGGDGLDDPITDSGDDIDDDCEDETDSSDTDEEDCEEEDDSTDSTNTNAAADVSVKIKTSPSSSTSKSSAAPQASPDTSSSSSDTSSSSDKSDSTSAATGQFAGVGTWYTQDGNAGACGNYAKDSDYVVALPPSVYNNGAHCGQKVKLTSKLTGQTAIAVAADLCPSCPGSNIDCSTGLFDKLSNNDQGLGVLDLTWDILS